MGHIVFAAPSIARFHLHERVARALRNRGHRVTVLATDPVGFEFYSAQGLPTWQVKPGLTRGLSTPLDSFAEHDCHLAGISRPTLGQLTRAIRPLEHSLGGLIRFFEMDTPDLLLLHQERDGMHRLLHFLAREYGCRILWTGDGLVPGTMQSDGEGLDGDASSCRLVPGDYRQVSGDETFLASVLASLLGRSLPPPLSRSQVRSPALHARLAASFSRAGRRHHPGLLGSLRAWRQAIAPRVMRWRPAKLPDQPFLAVLCQGQTDPRLCLDAGEPWLPAHLVLATASAALAIDPELVVLAILPEGGLPRPQIEAIARIPTVTLHPPSSASLAASTALAVTTVNHPAGIAGLLSGTPVLHTGRTLYGLRGVTTRTRLDSLEGDLRGALTDDQPHLRERLLTWLLSEAHLWCWADFPDFNGINGLVRAIETSIRHEGSSVGIGYRAGPVWPLQAGSAG